MYICTCFCVHTFAVMFNFWFIEGYINHFKKMILAKIWFNLCYYKNDIRLIKMLYTMLIEVIMNVFFGKHKGSLPQQCHGVIK